MSSLKGVKPGDELLLLVHFGGRREKEQEPKTVTVHKVGQTLVHILRRPELGPDGGTHTYRIEDGVANDGYGHASLTTRAAYEERHKRAALIKALRERGIQEDPYGRNEHSTATLEALLAALDADTATPAAPEFTPGEYEALFDAACTLRGHSALHLLEERFDTTEQAHLDAAITKLRAHIKRTPAQEN
ncbi:hypothetical protein [Streptomyces sp. NPDC018055]|uniref:beta barrel domain-containing protein n=1 Tax=Streptomyces sp. NPDC018055 TaxID=3365038 RepID=UPI0037B58F1B